MPLLLGSEPFHHDGGPVGVLCCHGLSGTPASMRPWAEHLAAAGFTVSAPRLPGHGTRWQDLNVTRWTDWYGEVVRSFDALRADCAQVFVAGLSMGGTLTIRLAEERGDEVAGIILVNPSLTTQRRDAPLLSLLSHIVPSVPGIAGDVKKPGVREVAYDRLPLKAAASLAQLWPIARAHLTKVTQPILLYRSRDDHVVEPVNAQILLDGVRSRDITDNVLEDSYHVATIDNDAPTIFAGSTAWIAEHADVAADAS